MKSLPKLMILISLLILAFTRCDVRENTKVYDLLNENTCAFPCWMEIMPGETSVTEAKYALNQLIESFGNQGTIITYEYREPKNGYPYFYIHSPGAEIFLLIDSDIVSEIKVYFTNPPTVKEFAKNFATPDSIGICLTTYRARPVLIYDGVRVYLKTEPPDYDDDTGSITIADFYEDRVDEVRLVREPWIKRFDYTFSWEEMEKDVIIDTKNPYSNSDCYGTFNP